MILSRLDKFVFWKDLDIKEASCIATERISGQVVFAKNFRLATWGHGFAPNKSKSKREEGEKGESAVGTPRAPKLGNLDFSPLRKRRFVRKLHFFGQLFTAFRILHVLVFQFPQLLTVKMLSVSREPQLKIRSVKSDLSAIPKIRSPAI